MKGEFVEVTGNVEDLKFTLFHESLPDPLLARIKAIWDVMGGYLHVDTLEQFETGFMHDAFPEDEVAIWEWISRGFARYRKTYRPGRAKLTRAALTLTLLGSGPACVPGVSEAELARIKACLDAPPARHVYTPEEAAMVEARLRGGPPLS